MAVQIGFLGFGEAAFHIAAGFRDQGLEGLHAYDVTLSASGERRVILDRRLAETGVTPAGSVEELLEEYDSDSLKEYFLREMTLDFLEENAEVNIVEEEA